MKSCEIIRQIEVEEMIKSQVMISYLFVHVYVFLSFLFQKFNEWVVHRALSIIKVLAENCKETQITQ